MNGPIAQLVALTCYGNASLRGIPHDRFFPDNSTCQFCDRVDFTEVRRGLLGRARERVVAATPDEWFETLTRERTLQLQLHYQGSPAPRLDDRLSAAFVGGGGQWSLAAVTADSSSTWVARWDVWDQEAPESRLWRVTYSRTRDSRTPPQTPLELEPITTALRDALGEIAPFARKHDCDGFAACFEAALNALDTGTAPNAYHRDLAPPQALPAEAAAVLLACQKAWVFGGMCSWNDMGFDGADQLEYERLSERLFQALNAAIVAAANSSTS